MHGSRPGPPAEPGHGSGEPPRPLLKAAPGRCVRQAGSWSLQGQRGGRLPAVSGLCLCLAEEGSEVEAVSRGVETPSCPQPRVQATRAAAGKACWRPRARSGWRGGLQEPLSPLGCTPSQLPPSQSLGGSVGAEAGCPRRGAVSVPLGGRALFPGDSRTAKCGPSVGARGPQGTGHL